MSTTIVSGTVLQTSPGVANPNAATGNGTPCPSTVTTYQPYVIVNGVNDTHCSCDHCDDNTQVIPCHAGDWAYENVSCCWTCPEQLMCATPDSSLCPNMTT